MFFRKYRDKKKQEKIAAAKAEYEAQCNSAKRRFIERGFKVDKITCPADRRAAEWLLEQLDEKCNITEKDMQTVYQNGAIREAVKLRNAYFDLLESYHASRNYDIGIETLARGCSEDGYPNGFSLDTRLASYGLDCRQAKMLIHEALAKRDAFDKYENNGKDVSWKEHWHAQ